MSEIRKGTACIIYTYQRKKYGMTKTFEDGFGKSLDTQLLEWIESLVRAGANIKEIVRYWN